MEKKFENGIIKIIMEGRLDSDNAPDADKELREYLADIDDDVKNGGDAPKSVLIDARDLEYISSAGIRVLLMLRKKIGSMRIINTSELIYDTISITGMEDILGLERRANESASVHTTNAPLKREPSVWQQAKSDIPLTGINDTHVSFDFKPVTILFEEQAGIHPDKYAVVSSKGSYTYDELNKAANSIANSLIYMGIKPDDVVCIMLERGIEIYAATLGVLKSGAAYTIVNSKYPDERIDYIYKDADCKYIISTRGIVYERLELFVDMLQRRPLFFEDLLSEKNKDNPTQDIHPEDLCYLIYTSGSTGKPKGVMIEHGNLSNFLLDVPQNREFKPLASMCECSLAMAQMTFDFSIMEQYIPLVSGHTVALALYDEISNHGRMMDFMNGHKVDGAMVTPGYMTGLLKMPNAGEAVGRLKVIDFGAEAFPGNLYTEIRKLNPGVKILNGYGPTETTISCTMKELKDAEKITIGRPNANVYVFVVDKDNNEVKKGEQGELLICGDCVGRGYMNLPDKTSEAFIRFHNMRAYKSGDLVRINDDDEIEYLGRMDNQVKIRGLRIELGEVENVIAKMEGVSLCAAAAIENKHLCLYYTAKENVTEADLRKYASDHLAHYMTPDIYVRLDEMPMTANQKIDRKALPKPQTESDDLTLPETDIQKKLFDFAKEVMTETGLGIDTNLVEAGMSSLDAMIYISLIGDEYNIGMGIGDLNEYPAIRGQEDFVLCAPKLKKFEKKDKYPATTVQAYYYAIAEDGGYINMPVLYEMDKSIESDRLRSAIHKTIAAHPGLTMYLTRDADGNVWQIPQDAPEDIDIPEIYMEDKELDDTMYDLSTAIAADARQLYRFEIINTPTRKFLFADYSHLNSDGASMDIIIRDIIAAYDGKAIKHETYTMFEYGEFMNGFWETKAGKRCIDFYMMFLKDYGKPLTFPADKNDDKWKPARIAVPLDADMESLRAYCRENHVTESTLLTAAFGLVLAGYTKRDDVIFSYGYSGRSDSRMGDTYGFVAGSLEVLCKTAKYESSVEYLQGFQKFMMNLMMYPSMPQAEVVSAYPNAMDITFLYQPADVVDYYMDGKKVKVISLEKALPFEGIPLVLQPTEEADGKIIWYVDFHENLYSEEYMRRVILNTNDAVREIINGLTPNEIKDKIKSIIYVKRG